MVTHPDPMKASERTRYHLVKAGRAISSTTFAALRGELRPVEDCLFPGAAPSQTYQAVNATT